MFCANRMMLFQLKVMLGFFSNHQCQGQMVQIHHCCFQNEELIYTSYTIGLTGRAGSCNNTS